MRKIITLSREFGSGGRELGRRIAEQLGIPCYDRQIIDHIASEYGLDRDYVKRTSQKAIQSMYSMTVGRHFSWNPAIEQPMKIAAAQHEFIRKLAEEQDCLIIGRCADVILSDMKPFNIFVYASMESRLERCREHAAINNETYSESEMIKKIKKIDKERAAYREQFTDIQWGRKEAFSLCINSSGIQTDLLVDPVVAYINLWFEKVAKDTEKEEK